MGWPGPPTYRQYLAWGEWRNRELNHPDLTQQYLMQVAYEVRCSQAKNPRAVKWEGFKLKFGPPGAAAGSTPSSKPKSHEEAVLRGEISKAAWLAGVQQVDARGNKSGIRVRYVDKNGNEVAPPPAPANGHRAPELP